MVERVLSRLEWLGHDCFLFVGPPVIYFNPYEVFKVKPADLILVTHEHPHHCSLLDTGKARRAHTAAVCDRSAARKIDPPVIALDPGEQATAGEVLIEAAPA